VATDKVLVKTDPVRRHKTFEFEAVYFTLQTLMASRSDICTVYSNCSPLGLFCLDNYPADLVVIFENGQIQIYQVDEYFVHGCDVCWLTLLPSSLSSSSSPFPKKIVQGQTHQHVRWKTNQCDQIFWEWVSSLNDSDSGDFAPSVSGSGTSDKLDRVSGPRAGYFVVSDCHLKGYLPWSLDKVFQTDPVMSKLVSAYQKVSEYGRCLTLKDWQKFMKKEENNTFFLVFIDFINTKNALQIMSCKV